MNMGAQAALQFIPASRDVRMACQDNLSFMRPLADGMMQLIVTSPPYNIGKSYERRSPLDAYIQAQAIPGGGWSGEGRLIDG